MASCGFVTISDSNYFPGVQALIASIRANAPADITVIDEGLTRAQRAQLYRAQVEVRTVTRSIPVNDGRFGCCYALFDIDAAPYENIVCIDPDAIVLADIRTLFALLDTKPIGAASSNLFRVLVNPGYRRKLRHAFPPDLGRFLLKHPGHALRYFTRRHAALCSGVVVVQRDAMRAIRQAAQHYADFYRSFRLPDQDLLSLCVADLDLDCAMLPFEINAATLHALPDSVLANERLRRKYEWISANVEISMTGNRLTIGPRTDRHLFGRQEIRVLHYAGPDKPWLPAAQLRPGFQELWRHYHDTDGVTPAEHAGGSARATGPIPA